MLRILAILLAMTVSAAAQTTQTFPNYVSGLTLAITPLTGTESFYVLQNGQSRKVSAGSLTGTPGGSNTQVQFNNSGAFGGNSNLTFVSPTLIATSVSPTNLTAGSATATTLVATTVSPTNLTAGSVTATTIVATTVSPASITAGTVTATNVIATSVTTTNLNGVTPPVTIGVFSIQSNGQVSNTGNGVAPGANAFASGANGFQVFNGTSPVVSIFGNAAAVQILTIAGTSIGWSASSSSIGSFSADTGISRDSAAVIDVGNGTPGNQSGTLIAATVSASAFTAAGKVGVSCAAGTVSTATLVVTDGIVTHC